MQWMENVLSARCAAMDRFLWTGNRTTFSKNCVVSVHLKVDADEQQFVVYHQKQNIRRLGIKGLYGGEMPFEDFIFWMCKEAKREDRWL